MTTVILQALALLYVFVLPGFLLVRNLDVRTTVGWSRPLQVLVGFAVVALVLPSICFALAWLIGTNVSPLLVLAVATAANAVGAVLLWWARRRGSEIGKDGA